MANNKTLDKKLNIDISIAGGMVVAGLASQQGLQSLKEVLDGANDPAQAIGHVVYMALHQVRQKLEEKGVHIDDKVWLADGGVLDRVIFEVVGLLYGVLNMDDAANPEFVHNLKDAIVTLMEQEQSGGADEGQGMEQEAPMGQPQAQPAQGLLAGGGMQ